MELTDKKRQRLAYVARRYYLENQKQSDIAGTGCLPAHGEPYAFGSQGIWGGGDYGT